MNSIQLGDLLEIQAPDNPSLHESTFYVSYIDSKSADLIDIRNYTSYTISLSDPKITQIAILSRSEVKGYARQNGLLPGIWVDIQFAEQGIVFNILTGQITNLEEDMIEVTSYPENEVYYIDFEYQGLPKNIPIQKIAIREKPSVHVIVPSVVEEEGEQETIGEGEKEALIEYVDNGIILNLPENYHADKDYHENLHDIYVQNDQIVFGKKLEKIVQQVEIPPEQMRYGLAAQTNDLLNNFLSVIPDRDRTNKVMMQINQHIQHFVELREEFSNFDSFHQVVGFRQTNAILHKPLVDNIVNMNFKSSWIYPVVTEKRKTYVTNKDYTNKPNPYLPAFVDVSKYPDMDRIFMEKDFTEQDLVVTRINNQKTEESQYKLIHNTLSSSVWSPFESQNMPMHLSKLEMGNDIDMIVSNDNEFNSTAINMDNVANTQFATERYNKSIHYPVYKSNVQKELMVSDVANLKSIITLSDPFIEYSRVFLNNTNILYKSFLASKNLPSILSFLKKKKVLLEQKRISFDNDLVANEEEKNEKENEGEKEEKEEENEKEMKANNTKNQISFRQLQHYYVSVIDEVAQTMDPSDKTRAFLDKVMPNIFSLLDYYNSLPNSRKKYSFLKYLELFEPFYIYKKDITFGARKMIKSRVYGNIRTYTDSYLDKKNTFETFLFHKFKNGPGHNQYVAPLRQTKNCNYNEAWTSSYVSPEMKYTCSELFQNAYVVDQGKNLFNKVTLDSLELITPNTLLDHDLPLFDDVEPGNECARRFITKKYNSIEDLLKDNDTDVYYDEEFDDTDYKIYSEYKKQKGAMENAEFVEFLSQNLVAKHKIPQRLSLEMAQTMILGKKKVQDGEYAILELRPIASSLGLEQEAEKNSKLRREMEIESEVRKKINYYIRKKGRWVYDKDADEESFVDTNTLFCNLKNKCTKNTQTSVCEDVDGQTSKRLVGEDIAHAKTLKEIEARLNKTSEELHMILSDESEVLEYWVNALRKMSSMRYTFFDFYASKLGEQAVSNAPILSPYVKERDLILNTNSISFSDKQDYIIKFVDMYCREPILGENSEKSPESKYWKYCKESNLPLMPDSAYQLAKAFQANNYKKVLDKLCSTLGVRDDDIIIDRETSYVLRKLEYDEQGAELAFGVIVPQNDEVEDEVIQEGAPTYKNMEASGVKKRQWENVEHRKIYEMINKVCNNMYIMGDDLKDQMFQICMELYNNRLIIPSEADYKKSQDAMKLKNTKFEPVPYDKYVNAKKVEIVAVSVIVGVQTAIPSVAINRTFSGCKKYFDGYPLEGSDMATIDYMACVLRNMYSKSIDPWSSITKKDGVMEKRLQVMIDKFVIPNNQFSHLYQRKRQDILENPSIDIPVNLQVNVRWRQFLPPIGDFSILDGKTPLRNITENYKQNLISLIKKGGHGQRDFLTICNVKIQQFAVAILEKIRGVVQSSHPVMMTMSKIPFLENACCNEVGEATGLVYFEKQEPEISVFINNIKSLSEFLRETTKYDKAFYLNGRNPSIVSSSSSILDQESQKSSQKTSILDSFSEENKYLAFIQYCHLDQPEFPIPEYLKIFFQEKPSPEEYNPQSSLHEKIEYFKSSGKTNLVQKFKYLIDILNHRNIISSKTSEIQYKESWLNYLDELHGMNLQYKDSEKRFGDLLDVFQKMIEQHNEESGEDKKELLDNITNIITPDSNKMMDQIQSFLLDRNYSKYNRVTIKKLLAPLQQLDDDTLLQDYSLMSIGLYVKNLVANFSILIPLRIQKSTANTEFIMEDNLNRHDLLENDYKKLIAALTLLTKHLNQFKGDNQLSKFLSRIVDQLKPLVQFIQMFPTFFTQENVPMEYNARLLYLRLFKTCILSIFALYIEMTDDPDISVVMEELPRENEDEADDELNEIGINIESGNIKQKVYELLVVFLENMQHVRNTTFITYKDVMDKITRSREREKKQIKDYFVNMDLETRKAEVLMKKNHLGKWAENKDYGYKRDLGFGEVDEAATNKAFLEAELEKLDEEEDHFVQELDENAPLFMEEPDEDLHDIAENAYDNYNENSDHDEY